MPRLTTEVAEELGTNPNTLICLIRNGRLAAPPKDRSGRYCWSAQDVKAARLALGIDRRRREHRQRQEAAHAD